MAKAKYHFNVHTLKYERVRVKFKDLLKRFLWSLLTGLAFAATAIFVGYQFFDSPKEKQLKREIDQLKYNYELLSTRMDKSSNVLKELQHRDDNIYRVVFEAEPISSNIRNAGFGGVERYRELLASSNGELLVSAHKKLDKLTKQLYVQTKSYDQIVKMIENKSELISSIPAIQPISNKNLERMASGFGWRTHPIYKISKFHSGMDFTANTGTPIYATGDGVIAEANANQRGYGNRIEINHGFGYRTLYAHLSKYNVKAGAKVKRGDVIGYVGNTGASTGPHLHYEVIKNSAKIDPINFFYSDLNPAEYAQMIELSSQINQSFD